MENTAAAQGIKEEGLRLFHEGWHKKAAVKFEQAREMFAADGNEVEAAEMKNNLGVIYRLQGRWDEAIAALDEAVATLARLGDRSREAQALGNLGAVYARKGERQKAKEYLRRASRIFADLGDAQRHGETLLALAVQEWRTGDRSGSLATYEAGLQTLQRPTVTQKALHGLLGLRTRLLGGQ